MASKTVVKSNSVAHAKMVRFTERKDRSLCVQMKKRIKLDVDLDKSLMEDLIKGFHSGIEHVYFPRQRVPRFFFVLCKDANVKKEVGTAIRAANSTQLGPLFPKKVLDKEFIVMEPAKASGKKTVDPLTLVLEAIPSGLETETIKAEFPKCKDTMRFNNSRCYVYFNTVPDAYEALKKVKSESLCGFKITARFNKVLKEPQEMKGETQQNTAKKTLPNNSRKNSNVQKPNSPIATPSKKKKALK